MILFFSGNLRKIVSRLVAGPLRKTALLGILGCPACELGAQCNPWATSETKALFNSLKQTGQDGIMLGHQDAVFYGLQEDGTRWWSADGSRSDIRSVTGEHPAVIGYDLGYLELDLDKNLDGVPFGDIRRAIVATYLRGGINTVSWHANNPLDLSKTSWDSTGKTIPALMSDEESRNAYLEQLDKVAGFFLSLKAPDGKLVPVIFRPFHEHTGNWFWWGADHCSPEEYKEFWKLTVEYLRARQVNNLLFAYSTDYFADEPHYLERYPGDDYVDLLGFDSYHRDAPGSNAGFIGEVSRMAGTLKKLGTEKGKPWALTETGLEQLPVADWWSEVLLKALQNTGASYVLVWRNGRPDHYYAPYPGHSAAGDLKRVVSQGKLLLERGVGSRDIYKTK